MVIMMTRFQEKCISACQEIIKGYDVTGFKEIKGESETYFVGVVFLKQQTTEIYVYEDEAGFGTGRDALDKYWSISEKIDFPSEDDLIKDFTTNLRGYLEALAAGLDIMRKGQMRNRAWRALFVLLLGLIAQLIVRRNMGWSWFIGGWVVVIYAAYAPLIEVRCIRCQKFPIKWKVRAVLAPLFCFFPNRKFFCDYCGEEL